MSKGVTLDKYFNSRKRPAPDDADEPVSPKRKVLPLDETCDTDIQINSSDTGLEYDESEVIERKCRKVSHESENKQDGDKISTNSLKTIKNVNRVPSLREIRESLAGSSRLAEIWASIEHVSSGIERLAKRSDTLNRDEFEHTDVESPMNAGETTSIHNEQVLSEEKLCSIKIRARISTRKVEVSKVPAAYIRHASLVTSEVLPLPHHYKFIAELFRSVDTVVSLLYNRSEKITFSKIKPSVEKMLKVNFSEKHLAQIKTLVPDFYYIQIQKVKKFSTSSHNDTYELVMTPNLPNNTKNFNPSVLLERYRYVYDALLQLVKKHHVQFLKTLDPPLEICNDKLSRWHPDFELEKIPEIICATLPEAPTVEKLSNAQEVLARARELLKYKKNRAPIKLDEQGLTEKEMSTTSNTNSNAKGIGTQTNRLSTSAVSIMNPALRNLPAALIEKVKAKQAAKALESMTRGKNQEYQMYSRLPDLAKTLRNMFVTERKNTLALNSVLSKLHCSFKSNVSIGDLEKDVKLLVKEAPEWVQLHSLKNTSYLKLDRNAKMNQIICKLDELVNNCKRD